MIEDNKRIIEESGLEYKIEGSAYQFRDKENKPNVDFYPSTGRWRFTDNDRDRRIFTGGANAFVHWYRDQEIY